MKRDLVERALLPDFGLREPERLTLGIEQSALPAKMFLATNFNEPVHELDSSGEAKWPIKPQVHPSRFHGFRLLPFVAVKKNSFNFPSLAPQRSMPKAISP
jgi:hypothetical protein